MTIPDRTSLAWWKSGEGAWQKSSFSASTECVEVGFGQPDLVAVRDSKNTAGPMLTVPTPTWLTFSALLRDDRVRQ
jgi:Domain of unknown function (DUF397)